jgi:hypothetical protein
MIASLLSPTKHRGGRVAEAADEEREEGQAVGADEGDEAEGEGAQTHSGRGRRQGVDKGFTFRNVGGY